MWKVGWKVEGDSGMWKCCLLFAVLCLTYADPLCTNPAAVQQDGWDQENLDENTHSKGNNRKVECRILERGVVER